MIEREKSMAQIQVLDQNTINQIAAGEVIERPSSIVKELLENAIDAGASAVTVEIKEGGISFIRITDNGCGIPKDQIPLAFLRHSTSKIRTALDLSTVHSLGFRGEALSSIASIAQVELITKVPEALTGVSYRIEGGEEKSMEDIGAPDGTTFLVRNVFFNTPVRRKFLKTPMTEGSYINELVERMALSHPEVSIRYIHNGQNKLYTMGNGKVKDLIYTIFGREMAANVIPVSFQKEGLSVTGFLGKPVIARGNRGFENYFVNGRYVRSSLIYKAIETAYKPFMMQHRYPFTVLYITMESDDVDVNVHPAKLELRFKNEMGLYEGLIQGISSALEGKEFIPEVALVEEKKQEKSIYKAPEPFEKRRIEMERKDEGQPLKKAYFEAKSSMIREAGNDSFVPSERVEQKKIPEEKRKDNSAFKEKEAEKQINKEETIRESVGEKKEKKPQQMTLFEEKLLSEKARSSHRLIGQLFDTYWLIQFEDKLFIMDQHAAHEKVLYEHTMKGLKEHKFHSQMVSPPIIISLSRREEDILKRYGSSFKELGYEIESFGGREYAISAVPANMFGIPQLDVLMELFAQLGEELSKEPSDLIMEKIASISCKAAVKGNHTMSFREADALIDQLMTLDNPYACPHGRPTIISMSKYEIEKKFKRIVT